MSQVTGKCDSFSKRKKNQLDKLSCLLNQQLIKLTIMNKYWKLLDLPLIGSSWLDAQHKLGLFNIDWIFNLSKVYSFCIIKQASVVAVDRMVTL